MENLALSNKSALETGVLLALDNAISVLSSTIGTRKHFEKNIEWLEARRNRWVNGKWRIGMIGITSTGKSTLLNAIMDEKLLPAHVRPSSNSVAICAYGERLDVVVHYSDGSEEIISENHREKLGQIADEFKNPNNRLGVQEIELFLPKFRFGKNIELVDTPGLDAHGYDEHERLTLKTLMPTVDLAIFLSTAKATSDALVRRYVDIIGEEGKPIIVVQNMIDSVEPKLGHNGIAEKSKEEVRREHQLRLQRLLKNCSSPMAREAHVLQVSAQWAIDGRLEESGLPQLRKTIEQKIAQLSPILFDGRRKQLLRHLIDIERLEREVVGKDISSIQKKTKIEIDIIDGAKTKLDFEINNLKNNLDKFINHSVRDGEEFKRLSEDMDEDDYKKAEKLKISINTWVKEIPNKAVKVYEEGRGCIMGIANDINLMPEDYEIPVPRTPPGEVVSIETEEKTSTRKVKRNTVGGTIKRGFGWLFGEDDWGYDEINTTKILLKVHAFRNNVCKVVKYELDWIEIESGKIIEIIEEQARKMHREISRKLEECKARESSQLEMAQRIDVVDSIADISKSIEELPIEGSALVLGIDESGTCLKDGEKSIVVPRVVSSLFQLSANASKKGHLTLRRECLARAKESNSKAFDRVLLWGWDFSYMSRFLDLYWFDLKSNPVPVSGRLTRWDMDDGCGTLGVAVDEDALESPLLSSELKSFLFEPCTLFLLLDPHQVGSTENQLVRSVLKKHLPNVGPVVVVAQAMRSLFHSTEDIAEGVIDLSRMTKELNMDVVAFLANDDSIALSVLLDALWFEGHKIRTQQAEEQLLRNLQSPWFRPPVDAGGVIRSWRNLTQGGMV